MKKQLLFFCLILLSLSASAQQFHAGLTGGLTVTDIPGMDPRDPDEDFNKLGFVAGGIVSTILSDQNDFQFELNFIQKGSAQRPDSLNNGQFSLALNYVEVPFVFRHRMNINLKQKTVRRLGFECGLSLGRLVHERMLANNYTQTLSATDFNYTDISLLAGLDYLFTDHFMFSLRYSNSVIPAVKRNAIMPGFVRYSFNQGNNMVFQLSFKYIFGKATAIQDTNNQPPPTDNQ
ncbi:MAG TPA: outer membrane beta-barrel protein [Bacteroidia bacterium]|nr:outer membrane beta-barrel protein [Bacteroidia bacterium]